MTRGRSGQDAIRFNACVFCDDIRHEKTDKDLLIGVYGGPIVVPAFPVRIAISVWLQLEAISSKPTRFELGLFRADGFELALAELDLEGREAGTRAGLALRGMPVIAEAPTHLTLRHRPSGTRKWHDIASVRLELANHPASAVPAAANEDAARPGPA